MESKTAEEKSVLVRDQQKIASSFDTKNDNGKYDDLFDLKINVQGQCNEEIEKNNHISAASLSLKRKSRFSSDEPISVEKIDVGIVSKSLKSNVATPQQATILKGFVRPSNTTLQNNCSFLSSVHSEARNEKNINEQKSNQQLPIRKSRWEK
jgi:hypothetical protein